MKRVCIGLILLLSLHVTATSAQKRPRILTTFLPGYCIAANVAGKAADVENLLPGNVSLHDYQLSPGDLAKLSSADLIVINGLGMETFLDRALRNSKAGTQNKLVTLTEGLEADLLAQTSQHRAEPDHDHDHDPHVWLDPRLAARCVTNVVHALQKADPENAAIYSQNGTAYIQKLLALDAELERKLAPVREVAFVTYHDAFRYFVRRFRLNLVGVVEQVPEVSPSAREMSALLKTMRENKVKALFSEPGEHSRLAERIAKDAKIQLGILDPLETGDLTRDSYERGMRKNAASLIELLQ